MRVALFSTCLIDAFKPSIGFSTIELLEMAGCEVTVPSTQTCCGQPAFNSGDRKNAKRLAQKWITEFSDYDYIVIPSGSCGGMVKSHYQELLEDKPDLLAVYQKIQKKVYELTDFLVNVVKLHEQYDRLPNVIKGKVTYHDSCSGLRELRIKQQPRVLLNLAPDLQLIEMADCENCCGFGGTFSVKYGDISARIADVKCEHIQDTKCDAVVLGDLGCMLNIEGKLRRKGDKTTQVLHIAQALTGFGHGRD